MYTKNAHQYVYMYTKEYVFQNIFLYKIYRIWFTIELFFLKKLVHAKLPKLEPIIKFFHSRKPTNPLNLQPRKALSLFWCSAGKMQRDVFPQGFIRKQNSGWKTDPE